MKTTGVIRKLDELGRITLPIELRRSLDLDVKDGLEITVQETVSSSRKRNVPISLPAVPMNCLNTKVRRFPNSPLSPWLSWPAECG